MEFLFVLQPPLARVSAITYISIKRSKPDPASTPQISKRLPNLGRFAALVATAALAAAAARVSMTTCAAPARSDSDK